MSDTRLSITPGWNPTHLRWHDFPMTPKMQARECDHVGRRVRGRRFNKNGKNSTFNLERKVDALREKEARQE